MKNKKGFTITELLVSFVLLTIVIIYLLKATINIITREDELLILQEYNVFESTLLNKFYEDIDGLNDISVDTTNPNEINFKVGENDSVYRNISFSEEGIYYNNVLYELPTNASFNGENYYTTVQRSYLEGNYVKNYTIITIPLILNKKEKNINIIVQNTLDSINSILIVNLENKTYRKIIEQSEETIDLENQSLDSYTNVYCNNSAIPKLENNNLIVSKLDSKSTICTFSTSLNNTAFKLDNSENNIVMLSDENVTSNVDFEKNSNVIIDLNGKNINLNGKYLRTYSNLVINDVNGNGSITSTSQVLNNSGPGTLTINNGYFERTSGTGTTIYNDAVGSGNIVINGGTFVNSGNGYCIQNKLSSSTNDGTININSGTYISNNKSTIVNYFGTINIVQKETPIYINTMAQTWNPAIRNTGPGTINIIANNADKCTTNSGDTSEGLCVYAEGDENWSADTSNTAVANDYNGIENNIGIININGGTYFGGFSGITNHFNGVINIKNGNIISNRYGIGNGREATTNICGSIIESSVYDFNIWTNITTGTINYSDSVIFKSRADNIPSIVGATSSVNANYTGMCE